MNEKELRRMSRQELLQMLLQTETERLRLAQENKRLEEQLNNRILSIENAGSLAEAALMLNGVFKAADEAAKQYLENIKHRASVPADEGMKAAVDEDDFWRSLGLDKPGEDDFG